MANFKTQKMYLGTQEITKAYLGATLVKSAVTLPTEDIFAQFNFEDNLNDTVGGNNAIALQLSYVDGIVGRAVYFKEGVSAAFLPTDFNPFSENGVDVDTTLTFIVKPIDFGFPRYIYTMNDGRTGENLQFEILHTPNGKIIVKLQTSTNANSITILTDVPTSGEAFHFGVTYNASMTAEGLVTYVNGIDPGNQTRETKGNYTGQIVRGRGAFGIPTWSQGDYPYQFVGYMDQFKMWRTVVNPSAMHNLATKEMAGEDVNPI